MLHHKVRGFSGRDLVLPPPAIAFSCMAKPNRNQFQPLREPQNVAFHTIEWTGEKCYRATMAPTHLRQNPTSARETIVHIAEIAIADAAALGQGLDRSDLLAELVALFEVQLAAAHPDDKRDELPPWKRFPGAFSSRYDYVETVVESSETSSFYEAIPLDMPHDIAKRKVTLLAQSYRNYPED